MRIIVEVVVVAVISSLLVKSSEGFGWCTPPNNTVGLSLSSRRRSSSSSSLLLLSATRIIKYEDMKAVELKKLVSEIPSKERKGLKLTKKAEFIEFLNRYYNNNNNSNSNNKNNVVNGAGGITKHNTDVNINSNKIISKSNDEIPNDSTAGSDTKLPSTTTTPRKKRIRTMPTASAAAVKSANKSGTEQLINNLVFERYPPLDATSSEYIDVASRPELIGDEDIRAKYHPLKRSLRNTTSDMDVVFLGTASCAPSATRSVSCTAIRLNWANNNRPLVNGGKEPGNSADSGHNSSTGTWIFDCGECSQLQVQKVPSIRPSKINKIFLTHCHGDHTFGLPGLLCMMGQNVDKTANTNIFSKEERPIVDIYGPQGLRLWLRVSMRYTQSRICPRYRVHELVGVPMAPEWVKGNNNRFYFKFNVNVNKAVNDWGISENHLLLREDMTTWQPQQQNQFLAPSEDFGEVPGGKQIYPNYDHPECHSGAPIYECVTEDDLVKVVAAPMSHGVPCVGYVVHELPKPGRLHPERIEPIIQSNYRALKELGYKHPKKVMAVVKNLEEDGSFTFPDGTVVHKSDIVDPPREGRKVVVCGDTADSRSLLKVAKGADLVIHEATNAFIPGIDNRDTTPQDVTSDAKRHGHSTPLMAANFAKQVDAKMLIMNHFSSRYRGDQSFDSIKIMTKIEMQAIRASSLSEENVACSWDYMQVPLIKKE